MSSNAITPLLLERTLASLRGSSESIPHMEAATRAQVLASLLALKGTAMAELRLQCLHEFCIRYYMAAVPTNGLAAAAAGIRLAREIGSASWERRMLTCYGILLGDAGNLPESCEAYASALDVCDQLRNPFFHAAVWLNSGTTFLYAGLFELAIRSCEQACGQLAKCESSRDVSILTANSLATLAYACLLTKRYALGLRSVKRAVEARAIYREQNPEEVLNRVLDERTFAWLLLRVGDYAGAMQHADIARQLADGRNGCVRSRAIAESCVGLCETYLGNPQEGIQRIERAFAQPQQEHALRIYSLYMLIEANDFAGRPSDADMYRARLAEVTHDLRVEKLLLNHRRHINELAKGAPNNDYQTIKVPRLSRDEQPRSKRIIIEQPLDMLINLCGVAELHDDPSGKHAYRVSTLASLLVLRASADSSLAAEVAGSAIFHDIGKVAIPDDVLRKPGRLSDTEVATMRRHTVIGADILKSANLSLETAIDVARHHHEFWNGAGYPDGLSGEQIPYAARVTAIVEAFDALTHDRPYRPAITVDRALAMIVERAGHQFDPSLVGPFCELIAELRSQHPDLDEFLGRDAVERSAFLRAQQRMSERMDKTASIDQFLT